MNKKNSNTQYKLIEFKKYREPLKTKIYKYSSFEPLQIGLIVAKLVSIIEGEEYSCIDADYDTYRYDYDWLGKCLVKVRDRLLIIKKGNETKAHYKDVYENENVVDQILEQGDAFVLARSRNTFTSNSISFYYFYEDTLKQTNVDYRRFSYVKDFIDLVIEYRLKNNVDDLSQEELFNLLSEFAINNRKLIESNYKKRDIERVNKYKQMLREEKQRRDIEIDKVLSLIKKKEY